MRPNDPTKTYYALLFHCLLTVTVETETSQPRQPPLASTSLWSLITWLADKSGHQRTHQEIQQKHLGWLHGVIRNIVYLDIYSIYQIIYEYLPSTSVHSNYRTDKHIQIIGEYSTMYYYYAISIHYVQYVQQIYLNSISMLECSKNLGSPLRLHLTYCTIAHHTTQTLAE